MGLVEHAAGNVQQVAQPLADQLLRRDADPGRKGPIGSDDAAVGLQREIAAWRVLKEVFQIFNEPGVRERPSDEVADRGDNLLRRAQVRAVAGRVEVYDLAAGYLVVDVFADLGGRDDVVAALHDQRRHCHPPKVGPIVRAERHARKLPRDLWVGSTEAVGQLLAKFRPVGIAHDCRRHRRRPAHMVVCKRTREAR